jgi:hypothetical protein
MLITGVGGLAKNTVYTYSTKTEIVKKAVLPSGIF